MKNHLINKIAICVSAVFSVLSLTACPAFLSETFGTFSNMEKVSSMPGTNYQWEEISLENAKNLWTVTPDMNSKKNVYKHADVYEKESAFHCSIVHNGLKNASGTNLQLNGAMYGSGIYMSPYLPIEIRNEISML